MTSNPSWIPDLLKNLSDPPYPWSPSDTNTDPQRLFELMISSIHLLKRSTFYRRFLSRLREPHIQDGLARFMVSETEPQMVVYGIGSIESCDFSRLQLAFVLLLRKELGWHVASVEVFDPVISATECAVMEALGCVVLRHNERGLRRITAPTLFFMPHCEAALYDNVLRANWHPAELNRIVVLGNSFSSYKSTVEDFERLGFSGSIKLSTQFVRAVRKYVREFQVEGAGRIASSDDRIILAFTEISWHFFQLDDEPNTDIFPTNNRRNRIKGEQIWEAQSIHASTLLPV